MRPEWGAIACYAPQSGCTAFSEAECRRGYLDCDFFGFHTFRIRALLWQAMLSVYLMQNWFALSDPAMKEAPYEIASLCNFAGLDLQAVPDDGAE